MDNLSDANLLFQIASSYAPDKVKQILTATDAKAELKKAYDSFAQVSASKNIQLPKITTENAEEFLNNAKLLAATTGNKKLSEAVERVENLLPQKGPLDHEKQKKEKQQKEDDEEDVDGDETDNSTLSPGQLLLLGIGGVNNASAPALKEYLSVVRKNKDVPSDRKNLVSMVLQYHDLTPERVKQRALYLIKQNPNKKQPIMDAIVTHSQLLDHELRNLQPEMQKAFEASKQALKSDAFSREEAEQLLSCVHEVEAIQSKLNKELQKTSKKPISRFSKVLQPLALLQKG